VTRPDTLSIVRLVALGCCVAACPAAAAAIAANAPEELLARLIDNPVPAAGWAGVKPGHNIPVKVDISAGMMGTVALQRGTRSVRYMVYLSPTAAQKDFSRQANPPKEQSAGPMREVAVADWPGPAMVCGDALLATRPPQRVTTCSARHTSQALVVRVIVPPSAGAAAQAQRELVDAMRHADAVAARPPQPPGDAAARLYRGLRNLPIPRTESVADLLQGLSVKEDEVRAPNRADGVIGRLTIEGRGATVRYAVFGANARIDAWVDRAAALDFDGYQAAGAKDRLKESNNPQRLRAPVRSQLWANRRGGALCDVVARHQSLPLALRVSMPIKGSVRSVPNERASFEFRPDLFDQFLCFQLAIDLADWATERGTR
jgi:hypothetical protein